MTPSSTLARFAVLAGAWLIVAGGAASAGAQQAPEFAFDPPPRIVAIGDVHGAYAEFTALLSSAGLVDTALDWSGGSTRLVVLGDVLDRGAESRRSLELLMRLSEQAARAGGDAQLVLGNHEIMNLVGDLRYVTAAEYAAYRAEEPPNERDAAWQRFSAAAGGDGAAVAAQFAARYPPGFFGHRALFAPDGRFGAWLLERPVMVTIGRTAFVHGGLPAAVAGRTASEINREYGNALHEYLAIVDVLTTAGALHAEDPFHEHAALAARFVTAQGAEVTEPLRRAAERVEALVRSAPFRGDAVFWYRGTAACSPAIELARLEQALDALGVDRVAIGHTPTSDGRVQSRFGAAVIRADTGMLAAHYGGRPSAVVIRDADVRVLYAGSAEETAPEPQPRAVGRRMHGPGDDELETLLEQARIVTNASRSDGTRLLQLEWNGELVAAVFHAVPESRDFAALPEVAAYRLDRLLELELVPVAVRRVVDGRIGTLQLYVGDLPTEAQRASGAAAVDSWCPLRDQLNAMYVFDVLTYSEGRRSESMRYATEGGQLVLAESSGLFRTEVRKPAYLRNPTPEVPGHLGRRLEALTPESLARDLGDVLDGPQRAAILARRDLLLGR
jgi:hypothetical protein